MKKLMALTALMILTACDRADRADIRAERSDQLYQSAMEDYRSGRLEQAIAGFEKVIRKDPGNASARFQLACLQQDSKADFLGAFCGYHEYLLQHPASDKAGMARDRLVRCEREVAQQLAEKHGFLGSDGLSRELESVRKELKEAETRASVLQKEVDAVRSKAVALESERDRLLAVLKGGADETASPQKMAKEARDLLDEEDEATDRIKLSADAAALRADESEEQGTGSSLLAPLTAGAKPKPAAEPKPEKKNPTEPSRPATYEVQEGDTLYKIAKRFYGRLSAWKQIKDANKALISADNRLRAGDVINLP